MATVTIRKLAPGVLANIKQLARARGWSMEQEIRALLEQRYTARTQAWAEIDLLRAQMTGTLSVEEMTAARHSGRR